MSGIGKDDKYLWLEILFQNNPFNVGKNNEALAYIRQNFMEFYNDDLFLQLNLETFTKILESDDLNVENEIVVFDSIRRWLDFNNLNPVTYLKQLLRVVRLPLLPTKFLLDEVEPYVYPILNCRETFLDTLRYHLLEEKKTNVIGRKYQKIFLKKSETIPNFEKTQKNEKPSMKLLSLGSDDLNTANIVEVYENNRWTQLKSLAIDRRNYSVALIDDKVMLIGGTQSPDNDSEPSNKVQSLDLATGVLSMEAFLNDGRQYAATVVVDILQKHLYVLGGRGKDGDLDSIETWNSISSVWTRVQPMPTRRTGLAAAVLNNKIYVLGGRINSDYTNTMETYYLDEGIWEKKASMKEARAHFCVAVVKGFLYAVAGSKGNIFYINTIEKYDSYDDSWITLSNIIAMGNVGVSFLENNLICAGGKNSKSVLKYDEKNDTWSRLNDLNVPRAGYLLELPKKMSGLQFNWDDQMIFSHKLLMIGNQTSNTACTLEVYDNRNNQWTRLNNLNIDKINYSVAYVGENLMIIGGVSDSKRSLSNTVKLINLRTGNFSKIAHLNSHREQSAVIVGRHGKLQIVYVLGGIGVDGPLKSVERWDPLSRMWIFVTSMTVARTGYGVALLQDKIYVVGGKIQNIYDKTMEAYDLGNDRWIPKASMKNPNAFFGITTFKNRIYVAGGNKDSGTPVNTVEFYDPEKNTWTSIASISSTGVVGISGLGNKLICAGGRLSDIVEEYDEKNNQWRKLKSLNSKNAGFLIELQPNMEMYSGNWPILKRSSNVLVFFGSGNLEEGKIICGYDIKENKWTRLKDLPLPRYEHCVNIIDNKLLIIGGKNERGNVLNTVDAFNLSTGIIESFPPLLKARNCASSVILDEGNKKILYIIGGFDEKGVHLTDTVQKWDSTTNEWTESIPMSEKLYGHGCAILHGKIYVIGGQTPSISTKSVEVFDINGKFWEFKASMKNQKSFFGITTFENHVYIVGGQNSLKIPVNTFERYDPLKNEWITLANIQSGLHVGFCSIGDRLICAGGEKNTVEEYDVEKNIWVSLPPMNVNRLNGLLLEFPENGILENWA